MGIAQHLPPKRLQQAAGGEPGPATGQGASARPAMNALLVSLVVLPIGDPRQLSD